MRPEREQQIRAIWAGKGDRIREGLKRGPRVEMLLPPEPMRLSFSEADTAIADIHVDTVTFSKVGPRIVCEGVILEGPSDTAQLLTVQCVRQEVLPEHREHWERAADAEAAHKIARHLLERGFLRREAIDLGDSYGFTTIGHRYSIVVETSPEKIAEVARQIDAARLQGYRLAQAEVRANAGRYTGLEGGCGHVIAGAFGDLAREMGTATADTLRDRMMRQEVTP